MTATRDEFDQVILRCDAVPAGNCLQIFVAMPADYVAPARARARTEGWQCWNPGPRRSARDLCPNHRLDLEQP